jgi:hypothetical protein
MVSPWHRWAVLAEAGVNGSCFRKTSVFGSRVELSTNVDLDDGLANGVYGQGMAFERQTRRNNVTVWVYFEEEKIGKNLRNESKHLYSSKIATTWTPIQDIKRQFPVGKYKNTEVLRKQLPLTPASTGKLSD